MKKPSFKNSKVIACGFFNPAALALVSLYPACLVPAGAA